MTDKPCLLCRLIGHKWTMKAHRSADSVRYDRLLMFDYCLRCGEPNPSADMPIGPEFSPGGGVDRFGLQYCPSCGGETTQTTDGRGVLCPRCVHKEP